MGRKEGESGIATQGLECPWNRNPTLMLCSKPHIALNPTLMLCSKPHTALNLKSFEVD